MTVLGGAEGGEGKMLGFPSHRQHRRAWKVIPLKETIRECLIPKSSKRRWGGLDDRKNNNPEYGVVQGQGLRSQFV